MPNPFAAKAKKKSNPFTTKAKKSNPFTAKARTRVDHVAELAELDQRIEAAADQYEQALKSALKGITTDQVKKRFDIADRHMNTLLGYSSQRKRLVNMTTNGKVETPLWTSRSRKSKVASSPKAKPSPTKVKQKSSPPPAPKKVKRTRASGTAIRIKARK